MFCICCWNPNCMPGFGILLWCCVIISFKYHALLPLIRAELLTMHDEPSGHVLNTHFPCPFLSVTHFPCHLVNYSISHMALRSLDNFPCYLVNYLITSCSHAVFRLGWKLGWSDLLVPPASRSSRSQRWLEPASQTITLFCWQPVAVFFSHQISTIVISQ